MKNNMHHENVSIGSQSADYRIILLHGWGADYYDLLPIGELIVKDLHSEFQIVCLRAPIVRPDNSGREWYGLFPANWEQAKKEVDKLVITLKEFGKTGIDLKKTVLLGFSQGAAMSIAVSSRLDFGLIVSCSGYAHPDWDPKVKTPVLLSHGLKDDIVPVDASREILKRISLNANYKCQLHEFNGSHEIDSEFINLIRQNIKEIF